MTLPKVSQLAQARFSVPEKHSKADVAGMVAAWKLATEAQADDTVTFLTQDQPLPSDRLPTGRQRLNKKVFIPSRLLHVPGQESAAGSRGAKSAGKRLPRLPDHVMPSLQSLHVSRALARRSRITDLVPKVFDHRRTLPIQSGSVPSIAAAASKAETLPRARVARETSGLRLDKLSQAHDKRGSKETSKPSITFSSALPVAEAAERDVWRRRQACRLTEEEAADTRRHLAKTHAQLPAPRSSVEEAKSGRKTAGRLGSGRDAQAGRLSHKDEGAVAARCTLSAERVSSSSRISGSSSRRGSSKLPDLAECAANKARQSRLEKERREFEVLRSTVQQVKQEQRELVLSRFRAVAQNIILAGRVTKHHAGITFELASIPQTFNELVDTSEAIFHDAIGKVKKKKKTKGLRGEVVLTTKVQDIMTLPPELRTEEQIATVLQNLQQAPTFFSYPSAIQRKIAKHAASLGVGPNRVIVRQGCLAEYWYFVFNGKAWMTKFEVEECKVTREGEGTQVAGAVEEEEDEDEEDKEKKVKKKVLEVLRRGSTFGDMAILREMPHTTSVTSVKPMQLLMIHKDDFKDVFRISGATRNTGVPDHVRFVKDLPFMKNWPWQNLLFNRTQCFQKLSHDNTVLVTDSFDNEWIYIVRSGKCEVYMYVEGPQASWRDLELYLAHPTINIDGWPTSTTDSQLSRPRKRYMLYNRPSAPELEKWDLMRQSPHLLLGPPYRHRLFRAKDQSKDEGEADTNRPFLARPGRLQWEADDHAEYLAQRIHRGKRTLEGAWADKHPYQKLMARLPLPVMREGAFHRRDCKSGTPGKAAGFRRKETAEKRKQRPDSLPRGAAAPAASRTALRKTHFAGSVDRKKQGLVRRAGPVRREEERGQGLGPGPGPGPQNIDEDGQGEEGERPRDANNQAETEDGELGSRQTKNEGVEEAQGNNNSAETEATHEAGKGETVTILGKNQAEIEGTRESNENNQAERSGNVDGKGNKEQGITKGAVSGNWNNQAGSDDDLSGIWDQQEEIEEISYRDENCEDVLMKEDVKTMGAPAKALNVSFLQPQSDSTGSTMETASGVSGTQRGRYRKLKIPKPTKKRFSQSSFAIRKKYKVPKRCLPPKPPAAKAADPYTLRSPPVFVEIEALTKGGVFGLDQLDVFGGGEWPTSHKVCLVSRGAEVVMLSKRFFMSLLNSKSKCDVQMNAPVYPSPDSVMHRLKLQLAWNMWCHKVCDEFHEDLRNRNKKAHGYFFHAKEKGAWRAGVMDVCSVAGLSGKVFEATRGGSWSHPGPAHTRFAKGLTAMHPVSITCTRRMKSATSRERE